MFKIFHVLILLSVFCNNMNTKAELPPSFVIYDAIKAGDFEKIKNLLDPSVMTAVEKQNVKEMVLKIRKNFEDQAWFSSSIPGVIGTIIGETVLGALILLGAYSGFMCSEFFFRPQEKSEEMINRLIVLGLIAFFVGIIKIFSDAKQQYYGDPRYVADLVINFVEDDAVKAMCNKSYKNFAGHAICI